MEQLSLISARQSEADSKAREAADVARWTRIAEVVESAINDITPKELCHRLRISDAYLSEARKGRGGKGIKAEWIPVILDLAPAPHREAILRALAAPLGYEVVRKRELSAEEKNELYRRGIERRFGTAGADFLKELDL